MSRALPVAEIYKENKNILAGTLVEEVSILNNHIEEVSVEYDNREEVYVEYDNREEISVEDDEGNIYEGRLKNGKYHGKGILKTITGEVVQGNFFNGKPNGVCKITLYNGEIHEGQWKNGIPHGIVTSYYKNHPFFFSETAIYVNGERNGDFNVNCNNGNCINGNCIKGKIEGKLYFYKNNTLLDTHNYINNVKQNDMCIIC